MNTKQFQFLAAEMPSPRGDASRLDILRPLKLALLVTLSLHSMPGETIQVQGVGTNRQAPSIDGRCLGTEYGARANSRQVISYRRRPGNVAIPEVRIEVLADSRSMYVCLSGLLSSGRRGAANQSFASIGFDAGLSRTNTAGPGVILFEVLEDG